MAIVTISGYKFGVNKTDSIFVLREMSGLTFSQSYKIIEHIIDKSKEYKSVWTLTPPIQVTIKDHFRASFITKMTNFGFTLT